MTIFLMLLSGITWTIVYIESIRVGIRDKSFAMPFWALALNITWELLHGVLGIAELGLSLQPIINCVWVLFDVGLLYTYFKYGYKYQSSEISKKTFILWSIGGLLVSFIVQYAFIVQFELTEAASYSAYLQNLLMSVLFITMLRKRKSTEGQSLLIAWSKFIGTLAPTILIGFKGNPGIPAGNFFIISIGVLIAVYDVYYIVLLMKQKNHNLS